MRKIEFALAALLSVTGLAAQKIMEMTPAPMRADERPPELKDVNIVQRLDRQLPLEAEFRDETGRIVKLGDFFGGKPVVLAPVYYECPMLCTQVLNGLVGSLKALKFNPGEEFEVIPFSFDPSEKPRLAADKKAMYLKRYGRPGAEKGWHFLTGDAPSINALTEALGFHYKYNPATRQFAHASAIVLATPQGRISRYFYGIEYPPRDVRLGLIEASENKIGSRVDQLLLFCYHYDPSTGKYGAVVMNIVRLAGVLTVLAILLFWLVMYWRGHQARRLKGAF